MSVLVRRNTEALNPSVCVHVCMCMSVSVCVCVCVIQSQYVSLLIQALVSKLSFSAKEQQVLLPTEPSLHPQEILMSEPSRNEETKDSQGKKSTSTTTEVQSSPTLPSCSFCLRPCFLRSMSTRTAPENCDPGSPCRERPFKSMH